MKNKNEVTIYNMLNWNASAQLFIYFLIIKNIMWSYLYIILIIMNCADIINVLEGKKWRHNNLTHLIYPLTTITYIHNLNGTDQTNLFILKFLKECSRLIYYVII